MAALSSAYTSAMPGDTITIANGTYDWGQINIINSNGTSTSAWIVVKAQTRNGVTFTGSTYFQFQGSRVHITGFRFANGNAGINAVMAFRSSSTKLSNYCRISNITIDNYNTRSPGDTVENEWIAIYGIQNRLDHCTFINKCNAKATVVIWYSSANFPNKSVSTFHRIDSNYFRYRTFTGGNGGETIRVGVGNNSRTDGYNLIEYNLFEDCTQADPEIVSNKSANNIYRYNTFKNCNGGLTLRMGRYCRVYGNYFINNNSARTESYGIRIIDKGHLVYNNYCEGLLGNAGSLTSMRSPVVVFSGNYSSSDSLNPGVLNGNYFPADSCTIAFNTIVNCGGGSGLNLGFSDGANNLFSPKGMKIDNNVIKMSSGQTAYIDPLNSSLTYSAAGNMFQAPSGLGLTNSTGFASATLNYTTLINGILAAPSVVQDAAINSASYAAMLENKDLQGQIRSAVFDAGADEINGTGNVIASPLDSTVAGSGTPLLRSQTITFPALGTKVWGTADFSPGATASSGLPVTYTSSNTAVVTIVNNQIHLVGIGSSTITASQSGNANYNAAPNVSQSITIAKANQTITFPVLSNKPYASPDYSPGASASSGLAITYSSSKTSVATIVNGMIHIVGVGSCIITAKQSGNTYYNAATSVTRSLTVVKADQTITFPPIPNKVIGSADFSPGATASSGLTVSYSSSNTAVATIVSGKIRIMGVGTCNITASQSGNTNYNAAPNVIQPLTVNSSARNIFYVTSEKEPATVFPNPLSDRCHFRFHLDQAELVKWELFSVSGKKIRQLKEDFFPSGEHTIDFYTGSWASGSYFLRMSTAKKVESFQVMILK